MSTSIVYSSRTGNTALLAERIHACLPDAVYFGAPCAEGADADVVFVGFWTDKGTCDEAAAAFLRTLRGRRVVLFGTAGFGGDESYFSYILGRVSGELDGSNTVLGTFMCQGRMPAAVRARYEAMAETAPEKAAPMLANFDRALSHPDETDLANLTGFVENLGL